jgi:hypothetical protein
MSRDDNFLWAISRHFLKCSFSYMFAKVLRAMSGSAGNALQFALCKVAEAFASGKVKGFGCNPFNRG